LKRGCGRDGVGRAGEDGEAAIPFATWPHHDASVPFDQRLDERVVSREGAPHHIRMLLPQPGTALNVGQEKGKGTYGQYLRQN
jgi:hypothetical protein